MPHDSEKPANRWGITVPALRDPKLSVSVDRGLAILESFSSDRPTRGVSEVADELGMKRSTAHRYLSTLRALGYLEQDSKQKYRLGLRVTKLGMSALSSTGLREHAFLYMQELGRRISYTVGLAELDGPDIVYVERVSSPRRRQAQDNVDGGIKVGSRLPAYCTASGKLLLAFAPPEARDHFLSETTIRRRTHSTIKTMRALRKELEDIRQEGYAVNDQEDTKGLHAVAVPVRSAGRDVTAALTISAHVAAISLENLVSDLMPHLMATADRISARLGHRRDDELSAYIMKPKPKGKRPS